jgi:hypothetical protein
MKFMRGNWARHVKDMHYGIAKFTVVEVVHDQEPIERPQSQEPDSEKKPRIEAP